MSDPVVDAIAGYAPGSISEQAAVFARGVVAAAGPATLIGAANAPP
jgi:hypothetical protein